MPNGMLPSDTGLHFTGPKADNNGMREFLKMERRRIIAAAAAHLNRSASAVAPTGT